MKFTSGRGRVTASVLLALLSSAAALAQTGTPPAKEPGHAADAQPVSPQAREAWRKSMARVPTPKSGCFSAEYPKIVWVVVPCTTAPERPYPPARGLQPDTVGNGTDYAAEVSSGLILSASGRFGSGTNATSETETYLGATGPVTVADTFSLQLNTKPFATPACNDAAYPSICLGWQQFVFSNSGVIFVQYWLLNYGPTCPTHWRQFFNDCWRNGSNATGVSVQPILNLRNLVVRGEAKLGGSDTITIDTGSGPLKGANNPDSALDLAKGWKAAEFNVFGDCCGNQAAFNIGATIIVETDVDNGTRYAPSCLPVGYTGETNNLTLVNPCCPIGGGILFTESSAVGAKSMCACPARAAWDTRTASCACQVKGEMLIDGQCACPPDTFFHAGQCECEKITAQGKCF